MKNPNIERLLDSYSRGNTTIPEGDFYYRGIDKDIAELHLLSIILNNAFNACQCGIANLELFKNAADRYFSLYHTIEGRVEENRLNQ